jgi:uncharacterized protein
MMSGEIVYFVIPVADAERAQAFYGGLFGWRFSPGNVPGGFNIEGSSPPGGLHAGAEGGTGTEVYLGVDDLEAAIAKVHELGGEAEDPQPTDAGHYSRCRDDQGNVFGMWAPDAG